MRRGSADPLNSLADLDILAPSACLLVTNRASPLAGCPARSDGTPGEQGAFISSPIPLQRLARPWWVHKARAIDAAPSAKWGDIGFFRGKSQSRIKPGLGRPRCRIQGFRSDPAPLLTPSRHNVC
jgi:hypothetical protein